MIFFDLDGTIWDATESTARAWTDVFARWNFGKTVSATQIRSVAGKPYLECLQIVAPEAAASENINQLLEELGQAERATMTALGGAYYEGAIEGLHELAGRTSIFLVSNCNDWYMEAFLDASGTRSLFRDAVCFGTTGLPKHENLAQLMLKHRLPFGFYVGDTNGDRLAAERAGLVYLHATYGFGGDGQRTDVQCDSFTQVTRYLAARCPQQVP